VTTSVLPSSIPISRRGGIFFFLFFPPQSTGCAGYRFFFFGCLPGETGSLLSWRLRAEPRSPFSVPNWELLFLWKLAVFSGGTLRRSLLLLLEITPSLLFPLFFVMRSWLVFLYDRPPVSGLRRDALSPSFPLLRVFALVGPFFFSPFSPGKKAMGFLHYRVRAFLVKEGGLFSLFVYR